MENLRVCFISFNYFPGQGLIEFFEFSRKLRRIGWEVYVIAAGRKNEKRSDVVDGVCVRRIPVSTVKRKSLENLRFNFLAARILSTNIRRKHINIVHVFSYTFSFLIKLGVLLSCVKTKIKWVYDIRSGPLERREKPTWIFRIAKHLLRLESTFFDTVFVIDENVRNEVFGNSLRKKTVIVPVGVDLVHFERKSANDLQLRKLDVKKEDLTLVYLGSLSAKRKLENLILAFSKACKKVGKIKLMMLGEGDDLNHLQLLTEKLSLSNKVDFLGYKEYSKIPKYLSIADIGLSYVPKIPSYDAQPPIKTLEYLACSLPVIATNTRGNRRFIKHRWNGLLTSDDPSSISEAIIQLKEDENLRFELSNRARASVKKYDWEKIVASKVIPAYKKVLQTQ